MTTIKLKNGSGAPTSGDLVQGEPALDLTNKRLYTEDSGGTVIEVGTNPTSLTTGAITATSETIVSTSSNAFSSKAVGGYAIQAYQDATSADHTALDLRSDATTSTRFLIRGYNNAAVTPAEVFSVGADGSAFLNGNVGIGTSSPAQKMHIEDSSHTRLQITSSTTTDAAIYLGDTDDADIGALVYDNAQNSMKFLTNAAERMRIDSSGNVGIGTSSPAISSKLNVSSTTTALDSGGTIFASVTDAVAANIGGQVMMGGYYTGTTTAAFGGIAAKKENATSGNFAGYLQFLTSTNGSGNTEKMRIDSSGNLLVGTTNVNPAANNVTGHALKAGGLAEHANSGAVVMRLNRTDSDGDILQFYKGTSTVGSIATVSNRIAIGNNDVGLFLDDVNDRLTPIHQGNLVDRDAAIDLGYASSRFKNLYLSGSMLSNKARIGTTTTLFSSGEFASINGSTSIALGLVNTSSSNGTLYIKNLHGDGTSNSRTLVFFQANSGNRGSITSNGSSVSYNTTSDYRLKENVVPLTGATERVKQLNPSRFNFIADADTTVDGFLAHEVADVVPEAITGTKDAVDDDGNAVYQGIDQSKLVPLLVATIQELEARIAALESN